MILAIVLSVASGGAIGQGLLTGDRNLLIAAGLALLAGGFLAASVVLRARRPSGLPPLPPPVLPSLNAKPRPRLGEILLRQGLLAEGQLEHALDRQHVTGQRLSEILVEMGFVNQSDVDQALESLRDPWQGRK